MYDDALTELGNKKSKLNRKKLLTMVENYERENVPPADRGKRKGRLEYEQQYRDYLKTQQ